MFGDNKSVVDSASIPTSTLPKESALASYHRVREANAAEHLQFNWKDEKSNRANILTLGICKHLALIEASTLLEGRYMSSLAR